MSYLQPQVQVFTEADLLPTAITEPLRACIIGGNAELFRYSEADEKTDIALGDYDYTQDVDYSYPNRPAGGIVDQDYFRLWGDSVRLKYHEDLEGGGYGIVAPVAGYSNRIRSDTVAYIANTFNSVSYPRHASLLDRDCQVGDIVNVRAASGELRTTIKGFHGEPVAAVTATSLHDAGNQATGTVGCSITQTAGDTNCITATCDASTYEGEVEGDVTETYTITVTQASVGGDLTTALLRVRSASGNDDADNVVPSAAGVPTAIGTRGFYITFNKGSGSSCSLDAVAAGVSEEDLLTGQVWTADAEQDFTPPDHTSGGTYTGSTNTRYIVTVTRGGEFAATNKPQVTVTTTTGVDLSGPTDVSFGVAVAVGTQGVTITFDGPGVDRLCKNDIYYIDVTAAGEGSMQTIELTDNLSAALLAEPDLELKLYIGKDGVEIPEQRAGSPPDVNYDLGTPGADDTGFTVKAGITAFDATWTNAGVPVALPMEEAELYAEYRAWVCTKGDKLYTADDEEDLEDIPGPLHPDNPLKWGVSKAQLNSNGTAVKYIAVCDPSDDDDWATARDKLDGNSSVYGLVPLTRDAEVLAGFTTHVINQSAPDLSRFRVLWVSLAVDTTVAISDEDTSSDGNSLLATVSDDPAVAGDQWVIVNIPAGNAQFITDGVEAGDIMRYNFTTDGWGNVTYDEFVIDAVINEDSLRLRTGQGTVEVTVPKKMEVWRTRTDAEEATALATAAEGYNNKRVRCVWPDYFDDGVYATQEGYFMCCILAGLRSGIAPNQGMTNLELTGVTSVPRTDDKFSRTELNEMADAGVWIVTELEDGDIISRHAITSAGFGELADQEEMIVSNVDSISFGMRAELEPRFGVANVVPSSLEQVRLAIEGRITFYKEVRIQRIGGQLIDGEVLEVRQHAVSKDRIVVNTNLTVPAPINNAELNQTIVI